MQLFQIPLDLVATTHVLFLHHTRLEALLINLSAFLEVYTFLKLGVIFITEQWGFQCLLEICFWDCVRRFEERKLATSLDSMQRFLLV